MVLATVVVVLVAHDGQTAVHDEATADRDPRGRALVSTRAISTTTEGPPPTTDQSLASTLAPPALSFAPPPNPAPAPTQPPPVGDRGAEPGPAPEPDPALAVEPTPTTVPIAAASSTCDASQGSLASAVLSAMNGDRAAAGVAPLCANSQLVGFAQSCVESIAHTETLAHQDLSALVAQTSFHTMGENIAGGNGLDSANAIEQLWMNSPAHRANILNNAFTAVGVGIAYSPDGQAWIVADFGG
jgi:uncharacterized protein YkwD